MNYGTPTYDQCFIQHEPLALLKAVVQQLRSGKHNGHLPPNENILQFTEWLQTHAEYRNQLANAIATLMEHADLTYVFSESGIMTGNSFFAEFGRRLSDKLIPHLLPENDLRISIRNIFNKSDDYEWLQQVQQSTWVGLLRQLPIHANFSSPAHLRQLMHAAEIMVLQIAALGNDRKLVEKCGDVLANNNAFTELLEAWHLYKQDFSNESKGVPGRQRHSSMLQGIDEGLRQVRSLQKLKKTSGTSLQQTFVVERLRQHLERLQILITIIDPSIEVNQQTNIRLFLEVVHNENTQNRIRTLISNSIGFLAFQIAEHGSKSGEKYISSNRKEYGQFFIAAAIGGIIISFAALIKVGLTALHLPYFWASFMYGANYAIAFVIIHLLHGTIATKQPALTASTIANAIGNEQQSLSNLTHLFAQVARSQFASLAGNLLIVFPLTILIALGYRYINGVHLIEPTAAFNTLNDVVLSVRNIWYAAIAGVLLFGSGIISGYFDNLVIFRRIADRLNVHPVLLHWLGPRRTARFAGYIEKNLGALMGNILLGFGLGFMIFFGKILGLPLDIRHVTISTGFFGFSLASLSFALPWQSWAWCLLGLMGIAFANLIVSFSLALYVALRSRRIATINVWPLLGLTIRYFLHFPSHFFFPPRQPRTASEMANELQ